MLSAVAMTGSRVSGYIAISVPPPGAFLGGNDRGNAATLPRAAHSASHARRSQRSQASEVGRLREAHARVVQPTPPPPYWRLKQETTARDARRMSLLFALDFQKRSATPISKKPVKPVVVV